MFKHKKTQYENIFDWLRSNEGTCFYCKEDKEIKLKLNGDKGICEECLENFQIGHIGTDRHVIHNIMPEVKSHEEAVKWLREMGSEMDQVNDLIIDDEKIYIYHAINNREKYNEHLKRMESGKIYACDPEIMMSFNTVEISESGNVHIIY